MITTCTFPGEEIISVIFSWPVVMRRGGGGVFSVIIITITALIVVDSADTLLMMMRRNYKSSLARPAVHAPVDTTWWPWPQHLLITLFLLPLRFFIMNCMHAFHPRINHHHHHIYTIIYFTLMFLPHLITMPITGDRLAHALRDRTGTWTKNLHSPLHIWKRKFEPLSISSFELGLKASLGGDRGYNFDYPFSGLPSRPIDVLREKKQEIWLGPAICYHAWSLFFKRIIMKTFK